MHLNDGQLRAYLDHALAASERIGADDHLATCAACRARRDAIAQRAERVAAGFAALASPQQTLSPQVALARFKSQCERKEIPLMQKVFSPKYRLAWALVGLVALAAISMTLPPVRAAAEGLLAQFRVAKISVVSVDATRLQSLGYGSDLSKQITQLLSDSVVATKKPSAPQSVASAAQASQLAGFAVRLPSNRSDAPQLSVQDGGAFQLTVNRARSQQLLNDAGASNLKLPASIDGAVIKVMIPTGVTAGYGDCPKLADLENTKVSPPRLMVNCIILSEIPSPAVDTPPDLDVQQLAELGLQFTGMTKDQAHAYAQTVDWTSTLVVPIPRNAAQYKKITVDSVDGYLIQRPADDAPQYAIIWVKQGIIYAVGGIGSDTTAALAMANSLK